jgi:hypothetical protein
MNNWGINFFTPKRKVNTQPLDPKSQALANAIKKKTENKFERQGLELDSKYSKKLATAQKKNSKVQQKQNLVNANLVRSILSKPINLQKLHIPFGTNDIESGYIYVNP